MTREQLEEIKKLAETWLGKEKDFYATGRDAAMHQFLIAMREYALPMVKALRETLDISKGRREEAFDWISAYFEAQRERDEARSEVKRLKSTLRLLWHAACDQEAAFIDEICDAVEAALKGS